MLLITNHDVMGQGPQRSSDKSVGKDCIPNKPTGASHVSQASNLNKPSVCQATKKEFLILTSDISKGNVRRDVSKALTFSKKMSKGQDLLPVCFRFVRC